MRTLIAATHACAVSIFATAAVMGPTEAAAAPKQRPVMSNTSVSKPPASTAPRHFNGVVNRFSAGSRDRRY